MSCRSQHVLLHISNDLKKIIYIYYTLLLLPSNLHLPEKECEKSTTSSEELEMSMSEIYCHKVVWGFKWYREAVGIAWKRTTFSWVVHFYKLLEY